MRIPGGPNKALDRMTMRAVGSMLHCERPWRAPCHRSALRSAESNAGRFEQEATEGTEMDSILCFLSYLLSNSEPGPYRVRGREFFSAYFECSAVTFPTHWQGRPSRAPWSRSLCWSWLSAPRASSRSEQDSHDRGSLVRASYFNPLKNSTRLRRSCRESTWPIPSGIGDSPLSRDLMSLCFTVTRPSSGELITSAPALSLLMTPA